MSTFGWSYPAGCSGVPGSEEELPEACPLCGADNANTEGEPVFLEDPAFCSAACAAVYYKAEAEAEAAFAALLDSE